jgi:flagellin-like protein
MSNILGKLLLRFRSDQRSITGLETAIVLIVFVVVSSVFAFAALSTGLFSSDMAKETISAGLTEAGGTPELKGSVIATGTGSGQTTGAVTNITF